MKEIFKDIKGYEGMYQVSNVGNVKSLQRLDALNRIVKERILKPSLQRGYPSVILYNGIGKSCRIHLLMAIEFLSHRPCGYKSVVDHKDFDRTNNHLSNLRVISQRQNTDKKHLKGRSKYVGVTWDKNSKKWKARILINNKNKYLGLFTNELKASHAYNEALKEFKLTRLVDQTIKKYKPIMSSIFTGVSWDKRSKKWISKIQINGKRKLLGMFLNELDASKAYEEAFLEYTKVECKKR